MSENRKRIEELEKRVEELERLHHPHYPPQPYIIPYVPPIRIYPYVPYWQSPWIVTNGTTVTFSTSGT